MKTTFLSFLLFFSFIGFGQEYNGYYNGIDQSLTGDELKNELHELITTTHNEPLSYDDVWDVLKQSDIDPTNSANVLLVYGNTDSGIHARSRSKNKNGGNNGDWNREHVYPKSLGNPNLGKSGPGADAHHIRPADVTLNSNRGNKMFADGMGAKAGNSNGGWFPGDEWKGDVARMVMYMYVRYGNRCKLTNVALGPKTYNADIPDVLIKWNIEDPVSDFERTRNDVVQQRQGNRNPFIDHPEWVKAIWGGPDVPPAEDKKIIFSENFNDCNNIKFISINHTSDINWACSNQFGEGNSGSYQINAYKNGNNIVSKAWAITKTPIDLTQYKEKTLSVYTKSKYGNTPLKLLYSKDYDGNGQPSQFTWTEVPNVSFPTPTSQEQVKTIYNADIESINGKVYFAFLYDNPQGVDATRWTIDNFKINSSNTMGTKNIHLNEETELSIYPNPSTNNEIFVNGNDLDKIKSLHIYNMNGQLVKTIINPFIHDNKIDVTDLAKGVYYLQTPNKSLKFIIK